MAMGAPRQHIGFLVVLFLAVAAPAWGQNGEWTEISRAGLQATADGRFYEAERLFRDALRLSEQFPDEDSRRATSVNNLAYILHAQGRYFVAEQRYRQALALR
jgi:Flp pilus assembly protein TadD